MIEIRNLTKSFHRIQAVDGISFATNRGEIFGLLGPNGAGKTTTLRMILSILTPTSGTITVDGIDVKSNPRAARGRIGCVLEESGLYERITAEENVAFYGRLYGLSRSRIRERTDELFAALEMTDLARRRAGTLSKGMKQKVVIARALIAEPALLIMDEPTVGLDVPTQRTILALLKSYKALGRTILYSTHIMSEAEEICDRVAIIDRGRIRAIGTPAELKSRMQESNLQDVFLRLIEA